MKKKWIMMSSIIVCMMAAASGCGGRQETTDSTNMEIPQSANSPTESLPFPDTSETSPKNDSSVTTNTPSHDTAETSPQNDSSVTTDTSPESNSEIPIDTQPKNDSDVTTDTTQTLDISDPNAIFIGGKVRSVSQNSFVLSRTLIEDSSVIMPEAGSPDDVLVTVRCSDSTVFEHWTIEGGGAGITKAEAAFSDIREGDGLEAVGTFDGEEFIAEKVIIELYR